MNDKNEFCIQIFFFRKGTEEIGATLEVLTAILASDFFFIIFF